MKEKIRPNYSIKPTDVVEKPEVETPVEEKEQFAIVSCEKLYFRKQPEKEVSNVIKVLNKGDSVVVLDDNPEWTKVKVDSQVGYCMSQFLSK